MSAGKRKATIRIGAQSAGKTNPTVLAYNL